MASYKIELQIVLNLRRGEQNSLYSTLARWYCLQASELESVSDLSLGLLTQWRCARASVVRKTLCGSSRGTITTLMVLQSIDGSLNSLLRTATHPKGPHSDQICKQKLQDFP